MVIPARKPKKVRKIVTKLLRMHESEEASHSGRLAITSPVVGEPVQVQEEGHRLRPAVVYFPAADVKHHEYTPPYSADSRLLSLKGFPGFLPGSVAEGDGCSARWSIQNLL